MYNKNLHRSISLFLVLVISFASFGSALASDGSLDLTFGTAGKVITDFGSVDIGSAVALQPDGRIVVAGSSNGDFALVRYNSDGSLDTTLDKDGIVTTDFDGDSDIGNAIVIQPDGRIVVAGLSYSNSDFALARYNTDGSLDTTFDNDGKVTTHLGGVDFGSAIALQPDGKIVVTGQTYSDGNVDFALARYNTDGSLDTTFDNDGIVITDFGNSYDVSYDVAVWPDGRIIVAGQSNTDFALARYNGDGSLDASFDTEGKVTTDFDNSFEGGNAVTLQADGKIVVAGFSNNAGNYNFALARYNNDGSADLNFDSDGKVTSDFGSGDIGTSVALQPNSKIVVAGQTDNGTDVDFALARYNSDGTLDMAFDTDGIVRTDFGSSDIGHAVALQPNGKIIMAGYSGNVGNYDLALARYDVATSAVEVIIDIKPGGPQNRIELEKNVCKDDDNLYVAILTTPDLDAQTVDASSLQLGDPNLRGKVSPVRSRIRDVDFDGDLDMVLAFPLCQLVNKKALNKNSTELVLIGKMLDGNPIMGKDLVKVVRDD